MTDSFVTTLTELWPGPLDRVGLLVMGAILLLAGRRAFWLAVGVVGFVAGAGLAVSLLPDAEAGVRLAVALVSGIVGAVLATVVQRAAVVVLGFALGVVLAVKLAAVTGFGAAGEPSWWLPLLVVVAGAAVAIASMRLFEGALVVLTAGAGAALLVAAAALPPAADVGAFGLLWLIGALVQLRRGAS